MFQAAETQYPALKRAMIELAKRDDDYARELNGQGFNGRDTAFGHVLAQAPSWSHKMALIAYKMARLYSKQLAAYGIDFHAIPNPAEGIPTGPRPPKVDKLVLVSPQGFCLQSNYDANLVAAIKDFFRYRRWNPEQRVWEVGSDAIKVLEFAATWGFDLSDKAFERINMMEEQRQARIGASKAASADFQVPGLGGTLRPFQAAGVKYAVGAKRVMIADEMGLGKTIQALATVKALDAFPVLVVCPASLKLNWAREARKWLPTKAVSIINGKTPNYKADVVILNYDILGKHTEALRAVGFKALVADESHYAKNYKAKRTKALKELAKGVPVKLLLTGTPVLNRPVELVSQLEVLGRLNDLGGFWPFMERYCGGKAEMYQGANNLTELNEKLRACCYIRREKADVLTELPPKQRSVVPIELSNRKEYEVAQRNVIAWLKQTVADAQGPEAGAEAAKRASMAAQLVEIEVLKQLAVKGKLDGVVEWVKDFLESGSKLVLWAHHRETIDALAAAFPGAATLRGDDAIEARQKAVDRFQTDAACNLFIGSMKAGGIGITLTAASNVAFVELGWTPADHDQAEDRVHRIGQTDSVNAWYLLAPNTIDDDIQELLDAKREIVTASTVGGEAGGESLQAQLLERLRNK